MVTTVTTPVTPFTVQDAKKVLDGQTNEVAKLTSTFKCGSIGVAFFKFLGIFGLCKGTNAAIKNAEQLDNLPKEIRSTVEKAVKAASASGVMLKHMKDGKGPRLPAQRSDTKALLKTVTNLTGKIEQLTSARAAAGLGDSSAETVQTFVQAVNEMFTAQAAATPALENSEDIVEGVTKHYVPNRALKAFNIKFAEQGVANITAKSFADHVAKMTTAFTGFTADNVLFKVLKQLAVAITPASITAHINAHDEAAVAAEATRRQNVVRADVATKQAPYIAAQTTEQATISTSLARLAALRGPNGNDGEIDKAWLASMRADCELVLAINQMNNKLSADQVARIASALGNDVELREMREFTGALLKNRSFNTFAAEGDVREGTIDDTRQQVLARTVREAFAQSSEKFAAFTALKTEEIALVGDRRSAAATKNAAGVVTSYDVDASSTIGVAQANVNKAQAEIDQISTDSAATIAGIPATVAAEYAEIVGFARKLETALQTTRDAVAGLKTNPAKTEFLSAFADLVRPQLA